MKKVRLAVIGLGGRGIGVLRAVLLNHPDVEVIAVCDEYEDRAQAGAKWVEEAGGNAQWFTDYKQALNVAGLDGALVLTAWEAHAEICLYAMEKGIPVGCEVGCEYTLENCYNLVRTQERTGTPYMFLENCCYDKAELMVTSMARKGLFGTIVHCDGAYAHDLRHEIAYGNQNRHYRFRNYANRCCENYPTHDFGPIAKLLDINRGNRIVSVVSMASKAAGLKEFIANREDATEQMKNTTFKQGDVIDTLIKCANGETVSLRLDTSLPRFYDRNFTVRGTKGLYMQTGNMVYFDGGKECWSSVSLLKEQLDNAAQYEQEYLPSIWKDITPEEMQRGHGGMDWFVYGDFIKAIQNNTPMPIDVYDGAAWMAISVLSEQSIASGSAPQLMPDFTNGKWHRRPRLDVVEM